MRRVQRRYLSMARVLNGKHGEAPGHKEVDDVRRKGAAGVEGVAMDEEDECLQTEEWCRSAPTVIRKAGMKH